MKRILIAALAALTLTAVMAFSPAADLSPSAQYLKPAAATWFSGDGWAIGVAIIAMLLIVKRRRP